LQVWQSFDASSLAAARISRNRYLSVLHGHIQVTVAEIDDGFKFAGVAQVAEVTYVS
jgi:hypothetical protein